MRASQFAHTHAESDSASASANGLSSQVMPVLLRSPESQGAHMLQEQVVGPLVCPARPCLDYLGHYLQTWRVGPTAVPTGGNLKSQVRMYVENINICTKAPQIFLVSYLELVTE